MKAAVPIDTVSDSAPGRIVKRYKDALGNWRTIDRETLNAVAAAMGEQQDTPERVVALRVAVSESSVGTHIAPKPTA